MESGGGTPTWGCTMPPTPECQPDSLRRTEMAKGGRPRLQGLDPQDCSQGSSIWPLTPEEGRPTGPPRATQVLINNPGVSV